MKSLQGLSLLKDFSETMQLNLNFMIWRGEMLTHAFPAVKIPNVCHVLLGHIIYEAARITI